MQIERRAQLSPTILYYLLLDVVGMVLVATGLMWLFRGTPLFFRHFPSSTMEAAFALAGGVLLMVVSAAKILREVMARAAAANPRKDE